MQYAAIAHQQAAVGDGDDIAERGYAILQGHEAAAL